MAKRRNWTETELAYLRERYGRKPITEICACLGRSKHSVHIKANRIGLVDRQTWTEKDDEFIRGKFNSWTDLGSIAKQLKRSRGALWSHMNIHHRDLLDQAKKNRGKKQHKSNGKYRRFTKKEKLFLIENYNKKGNKELAKLLGRNRKNIDVKLRRLGLKRDPDFAKQLRVQKGRKSRYLSEESLDKLFAYFGFNMMAFYTYEELKSSIKGSLDEWLKGILVGDNCHYCSSVNISGPYKPGWSSVRPKWNCNGCGKSFSCITNTIFHDLRISNDSILKLMFYWINHPKMSWREVSEKCDMSANNIHETLGRISQNIEKIPELILQKGAFLTVVGIDGQIIE